jgi:hypothetical protein
MGFEKNHYCHEHSDCNASLFCMKEAFWPYLSKCVDVKKLNDICVDDYSCHPSLYCWYATGSDRTANTKRCIELFAKPTNYEFGWSASLKPTEYSDFEYNGLHCSSGLANNPSGTTAKCVSVTTVT